jgi:Domain of unknown function (DUF6457)
MIWPPLRCDWPTMSDPTELQAWLAELCPALGIDPATVDVTLILDLARDAAHGVARPAAPVTTFLVGYAAGLSGGGPASIAAAAAIAGELANRRGQSTSSSPA